MDRTLKSIRILRFCLFFSHFLPFFSHFLPFCCPFVATFVAPFVGFLALFVDFVGFLSLILHCQALSSNVLINIRLHDCVAPKKRGRNPQKRACTLPIFVCIKCAKRG
jgi:hypothetical protein